MITRVTVRSKSTGCISTLRYSTHKFEIDFSLKAENTVIVEIRKCKRPCVVECAPLNTDHVTFVNI